MAFKQFTDEYYQTEVLFIYKETKESVDSYMSKHYNLANSLWILGKSATTSTVKDPDTGHTFHVICYQIDELRSGLMAHEVFHLACSIMANAGIEYSPESEEAYAYCIQYWMKRLVNWTYEVQEKEKKKNGKSKRKTNSRSKAGSKSGV